MFWWKAAIRGLRLKSDAAAHRPKAVAAWPLGRPPRKKVPLPVRAFNITTDKTVRPKDTHATCSGERRTLTMVVTMGPLRRSKNIKYPTRTAFSAANSTAPAATSFAIRASGW
jgi:hypothetical protein